jgi:GT2 family glycosyltransferase
MERIDHIPLRQVKRPLHTYPPLLTILIPSWNNLDYLRLCIDSIRRHSATRLQIIVHVNDGKDGTLEWLETQQDIDYTWSARNIGICYALNYTRSLIQGEYVVFLNDDMYVCPGWDTALVAEIRAIGHPWFFLSATMIEPRETGNPSVIVGDFGTSPGDFREKELLEAYAGLSKEDWSGATWPPNVVHRDVWDLVGGYSVEFSPGMYSDPDFSMKLWTLGIRLFKGVGRSRVYHFGGTSTRKIVRNKGYLTFIGKWGLTSGWVMDHVLRRGELFPGPLAEAPTPPRLKMAWKRLSSGMRRR